MPDVKDPKLHDELRQVKTTPMHFAFAAHGATEGGLVLTRHEATVPQMNEAKAKAGGGKVYTGRCFEEGGFLVLEMAEEPPQTLAKLIKEIITRDTGLTFKVKTQMPPAAPQPAAPAPAAGKAPSSPPAAPAKAPAGADEARFRDRLRALLPAYQKALQDPARKVELEKLAGQASAAAHHEQYAEALSLLDHLEAALRQAAPVAHAAPQAPPAQAGPRAPVVAAAPAAPPAKTDPEALHLEVKKLRVQIVQGLAQLVGKLQATREARAHQVAGLLKEMAKELPAGLETCLHQLAEATRAGDAAAVQRLHGEVPGHAQHWLAFLQTNADYIEGCEKNPWKVPLPIKEPVQNSLKTVLQATR